MQALISSSHRRQRVAEVDRGIAFLGTPHRGAGWRYATLGLILSVLFRSFGGAYTRVLKLFSDRDGLSKLRNEFRELPSRGKNKRTICFYETKAQSWPLPLGVRFLKCKILADLLIERPATRRPVFCLFGLRFYGPNGVQSLRLEQVFRP
jgi:hypothetical protein